MGLLNGFLVGYGGVSSILTTLGTMTLVNGICIVITGGSTIGIDNPRTLLGVYLLSSFLASIAGVIMMASGLNLLGVDPFFAIAMWGAILLLVDLESFFCRRV